MRLVDADVLRWKLLGFEKRTRIVEDAEGVVDRAPTVDAIPVKWIAWWVTTHDELSWSRMLDDWKAERQEAWFQGYHSESK